MNALSLKLTAAAAVLAAVFAPTASASSSARLKLSVLPLPQSALGAEGASLPLQWQDSGRVTNGDATAHANAPDVSTQRLKKLGRMLGYSLDYGDPYTGAAGVTEIKTEVDEYKTITDAKRGLAFWRKDVLTISLNAEGAFILRRAKLAPPRVGHGDFSYLFTEQAPSMSPIYRVVEQAREGRYVIDVDLRAGSEQAATQLAPSLTRKLDARVRTVVAGHLHGKPVPLKSSPQAGPPPGGPDLSKLVLQPSDVGQPQPQHFSQGYVCSPYAVSDYSMFLVPAGPYDGLNQNLSWYPSATEASQFAAYGGYFGGHLTFLSGPGEPLALTATPVDVSSAGDNATAEIVNVSFLGQPSSPLDEVVVSLRKGQLVDQVILDSSRGAFDQAGLQSVANAMAKRLDAGYPG